MAIPTQLFRLPGCGIGVGELLADGAEAPEGRLGLEICFLDRAESASQDHRWPGPRKSRREIWFSGVLVLNSSQSASSQGTHNFLSKSRIASRAFEKFRSN
jgi:hypothetical protein